LFLLRHALLIATALGKIKNYLQANEPSASEAQLGATTSDMIVLSYAPEDLKRVEGFYQAFQEAGLKPWMDSLDRPAGALWERALSLAIQRCKILVIFLSKHSVDKRGLLRTELIKAIRDWGNKETDDVYVVLVRLEVCKVPDQLAQFQKFDALDDLKAPQLVRLLQVLYGEATGKLDFLPSRLEYKLLQIPPNAWTHCDISVTIPQFDTGDNDLLNPVNSLIEGTAQDILEAFMGQMDPGLSAQAIKELRLEKSPNDGFWLQPIILTATLPLISIEFYISTYRRGETQRHHYTRTLNIDVENSAELFLKDIVNNEAMAMKFFSIYCENSLRAESDFHLVEKDWKFDPSGGSISQSFGFRNADLIFIFAPRDVGGHAFGRKVVELPFNDVYRFLTNRIIDLLVDRYEPADVDLEDGS
jgi:TIR domain